MRPRVRPLPLRIVDGEDDGNCKLEGKNGPRPPARAGHRPLCRLADARAPDHAGADPAADGRADRGHLSSRPTSTRRASTGSPPGGCSPSPRRWASRSATSSTAWTASAPSSRPRSSGCCSSWRATSSACPAASIRKPSATSPVRSPTPLRSPLKRAPDRTGRWLRPADACRRAVRSRRARASSSCDPAKGAVEGSPRQAPEDGAAPACQPSRPC